MNKLTADKLIGRHSDEIVKSVDMIIIMIIDE